MKFNALYRIRKTKEFEKVRELGFRLDLGCCIAQLLKKDSKISRIGIIASRKIGNAVRRNYAKRIFREIFRKLYNDLPPGSDLVIVVRSNFYKYDFSHILDRLKMACAKFKNEK